MRYAPVPPFYAPPRWEGAVIGTIGLAGYFLLAHFLGEGRGTVAGGFVGAFGLAVRIGWPLRKQLWFWVAILALAAVHALAVFMLEWSAVAEWNGLTLMPFMAADLALILVVIYFIYRWRYGVPTRIVGESERRYADQDDYPTD